MKDIPILKPKEIIETISNLKTGEIYKNDEEWKSIKDGVVPYKNTADFIIQLIFRIWNGLYKEYQNPMW